MKDKCKKSMRWINSSRKQRAEFLILRLDSRLSTIVKKKFFLFMSTFSHTRTYNQVGVGADLKHFLGIVLLAPERKN